MLRLSRQRADLGVALRAGLALLGARLAAWRTPKDAIETDPALMPVERHEPRGHRARDRAAERPAGGSEPAG